MSREVDPRPLAEVGRRAQACGVGAPTVVVVGSVNTDLMLRCKHLPLPGQTVLGQGFRIVTGGKGANQAVAAARLGAPVSFVGCVGDDDYGRRARAVLAAEGIDTTNLRTVRDTTTGVAMIMVESSGQNSIALDSGANAALSAEQVSVAAATIQRAALLVCQLESPLPAVKRAIELAHAAGVPVLLNPAPAQRIPPELLARVTVIVPNESETAALVTLGADGVHVADDRGHRRMPAVTVQAIDSTGAGDTFIGAFVAALFRGADLFGAVDFAQRAAALSVTRAGAIDSMPLLAELTAANA
jgi:ribokinase